MGAVLLGSGCATSPDTADEVPLPPEVAESISPTKLFDHRPYEMIWAERQEEEEPTFNFEGVMGWRVETDEPVDAFLTRSDELQLWDQYVGQLSVSNEISGRVRLVPPRPIPIRDHFDSVSMWIFGDHDNAAAPEDSLPVDISARIEDADGTAFTLLLARVNWHGWALAHQKVDADLVAGMRYPCALVGIDVEPFGGRIGRTIYFDSLSFYTERLPPLTFETRPRRNLPMYPGQDPGLRVNTNSLSFPTRPKTILPPALSTSFSNSITRAVDGTYIFGYYGEDGTLTYHIDPKRGPSGIATYWNGGYVGLLLEGARLRIPNRSEGEIVVLRQEGDRLRIEYANGAACDVEMKQKSLVADISCRGGTVEALELGRFADLRNPLTYAVPMLGMYPDPPPRVAMMETHGDPSETVFGSIWMDWYRSNASEWFGSFSAGSNSLVIQGGARYFPTTEGRRNDFFERVMLTISPRFDEVLPSIPNPKGLHAEEAKDRLWLDSSGPVNFVEDHSTCTALQRHGVDGLVQCSGREVWQDDYESYSLRTRAAPRRGGDAQLKWYVDAQRSLGWKTGLYANYVDLSPLSQHWSSDAVQRLPDGAWRKGTPGQYVLKVPRAAEFQLKLTERVGERFHPNASFQDRVVSTPPWGATDYDSRVPGAGQFAETFYGYGELLRNESKVVGGPVVAAGGYQWMYAGLTDAYLTSSDVSGIRAGEAYLPEFVLSRLQPLACGYGVGRMDDFVDQSSHWRDRPDEAVDTYLAAQLAYGQCGRMMTPDLGMTIACRSYFMMQQLQSRYALRSPLRIAYWDGHKLVSTSEALAGGVYTRSQMYFHYPGDLELWVNGSATGPWEVRVGEYQWVLPPHGWVAVSPDFLEVSAEVASHRIDYVESDAYVYYDGRGSWDRFRGWASSSPIVVRLRQVEEVATLDILNLAMTGRFGWQDPSGRQAPVSCKVYDLEGEALGDAVLEEHDGVTWFLGPTNALRYVVYLESKESVNTTLTDTKP